MSTLTPEQRAVIEAAKHVNDLVDAEVANLDVLVAVGIMCVAVDRLTAAEEAT